MKTYRLIILSLAALFSSSLWAWKPWPLPMDSADNALDTLTYNVEVRSVGASGKFAPFWFSASRDGAVSINPGSLSLRAAIDKPAVRHARWWDYSYGLDLMTGISFEPPKFSGCVGYQPPPSWERGILSLYGHVRLWCFDFTVGWKPETYGNQDEILSAGGFLWSRNAKPLPRITIGIDKWTPFPFLYGYLEVKGAISNAWFTDMVGTKNAMLHYKYIGVRVGGRLPVNLSYEFHHAAQWGGISPVYGKLGTSFRNWWNILRAKQGGVMPNDRLNAEGNHIGSQMFAVDIKFLDWKIKAYWQNLFEDGPVLPMWKTMNIYDGLWGVSIHQQRWKFIKGAMYELFHTTDQSGPAHDIDGIVFGGADSYFTNGIYTQGWTHHGMTMGNPFITSPLYERNDEIISTRNNRVLVHSVAMYGDIYGFEYLLRYSHAKNYGRYYSPYPRTLINNALLIEVKRHVPQAWNLDFGLAFGADWGSQFNNSYGVMITVARSGIIWKSKK